MATKVLYMTNNLADVHQEFSETSPGADATSSPNTGWTVGKIAAGNYAALNSGVECTTGSFTATIQPDGTINTIVGDCLRSLTTYNGDFAAGNWIFNAVVRAVNSGGDQDGNIGLRLFRDTNTDGRSATQITGARLEGAVVTNIPTTADRNSTLTFSLGVVSLATEYLFLQAGWEITGAGGANARDVIFRIGGSSTLLITTDFTAAQIINTRDLTDRLEFRADRQFKDHDVRFTRVS